MPDGWRFVFDYLDKDRSSRIASLAVNGSDKRQEIGAGMFPRVSADGRYLFYAFQRTPSVRDVGYKALDGSSSEQPGPSLVTSRLPDRIYRVAATARDPFAKLIPSGVLCENGRAQLHARVRSLFCKLLNAHLLQLSLLQLARKCMLCLMSLRPVRKLVGIADVFLGAELVDIAEYDLEIYEENPEDHQHHGANWTPGAKKVQGTVVGELPIRKDLRLVTEEGYSVSFYLRDSFGTVVILDPMLDSTGNPVC
jgi:hypothetical protein